eukprot:CAMPEP_0171159054 /NCGR_PEP_ID=MMETSP0790-20130122/2837_1 /TAXON_ID=2925 /ORGANISM="Alexandrium catenella, Strain OF101" /LENGTH=444 /DNA_ID=CAMNT_0011623531 /DNA_START=58 /DNA_END=1392 /DNA_ORIENTATION=+
MPAASGRCLYAVFAALSLRVAVGGSDAVDLCVYDRQLCGLQSFSGFVGVPGAGSLFYWYFEPIYRDPSAPLMLWLQGGPGAPSMAGALFEIGPVSLDANASLVRRPTAETWSSYLPLLFVDSPVGTGWSYAEGDGYARSQEDVARALGLFLESFARLHPEVPSDLVLAGESYGGHYIPALGSHLLDHGGHFTLKAVAIGDGLTDPPTQVLTKPQQAFAFGLLDEQQLSQAESLAQQAHDLALSGHLRRAADRRSDMEELIERASGANMYDVRTTESYAWQEARMKTFFGRDTTKDLLHVPRNVSFGTSPEVQKHLKRDKMRSQKGHVDDLLSAGVRVLLYQGQFDLKDGVVSNEAWIRTLSWPGRESYLAAERSIWRRAVDGEIAGYWRRAQNLEQVVVRAAGHMAPMDQPLSAVDMILRFLDISNATSAVAAPGAGLSNLLVA